MPIQHAIWLVGNQPTLLAGSKLVSEQQLEDMIVREPGILSSEWMLIGRQEITTHGGRIDLLAIAPDGALVLVELKRDRTPREIVAQALDYASWVAELTADRIVQIYGRFFPRVAASKKPSSSDSVRCWTRRRSITLTRSSSLLRSWTPPASASSDT